MAATTYIAEQGRIRRTPDGYVEDVVIHVDNVGGSPNQRRANALRAADNAIPYGSAHPALPGIFLLDQDAQELPGSTTQYRVLCTYRARTQDEVISSSGGDRYGPPRVSISSDIAQERAVRDINGDPMGVVFRGSYTRPVWIGGELIEQQTFVSRAYSARVAETSRPQMVVRIERNERDFPVSVSQQLTGAVNRTRWQIFPAKTLLCSAVNADEQGDGGGYRVTYIFRYNADTWRFRAEINLGFGANPPQEATIGNGIEIYDVYPAYDFNSLQIKI